MADEEGPDSQYGSYSWAIGVVLAASASLISNIGVNLQKLAHKRIANLSAAEQLKGYSGHPIWLVGIVLIIAGSIADLAALGFAAQSIIAPLGSLTLVANVFMAPFILDEKVTRREVLATTAIIAGSAIAVSLTQALFDLYLEPRFFAYLSGALVVMGLMLYAIRWIEKVQKLDETLHRKGTELAHYKRYVKYHRFLYASLSGTMGAQNVLFAKCAAELLINTFSGEDVMFKYYQTYLVLSCLGLTIFFQIRWLNAGLKRFDALYIVPVFQSFWILISVVSGLIFFEEYKDIPPLSMIAFSLGVLLTILGVFVLSGRGVSGAHPRKETKEPIALETPLLDNEMNGDSSYDAHRRPEDDDDDTPAAGVAGSVKRRSLFPFPRSLVEDKLDDWLGKGHGTVPASFGIASMNKINSLVQKQRRYSESFSPVVRTDATINGVGSQLENILEISDSGDDIPLLPSSYPERNIAPLSSYSPSSNSLTDSQGSPLVDLRDFMNLRGRSLSGSDLSDHILPSSMNENFSPLTNIQEDSQESSSYVDPDGDGDDRKSESSSSDAVSDDNDGFSGDEKRRHSVGGNSGINSEEEEGEDGDVSDSDVDTNRSSAAVIIARNQRSNTFHSVYSDTSNEFDHTPETDSSMIGSSAQSTPQSTPKFYLRKKQHDDNINVERTVTATVTDGGSQSSSFSERKVQSLTEIPTTLPDVRTSSLPDVRNSSLPDVRTSSLPGVRTSSLHDVRTSTLPDVRTSLLPDVVSSTEDASSSIPDLTLDSRDSIIGDSNSVVITINEGSQNSSSSSDRISPHSANESEEIPISQGEEILQSSPLQPSPAEQPSPADQPSPTEQPSPKEIDSAPG